MSERRGAASRLAWLVILFGSLSGNPAAAANAASQTRTENVAYADLWGPATGSPLPVLEAEDQTGRMRNLQSLTGSQGLLLFLVRSADW